MATFAELKALTKLALGNMRDSDVYEAQVAWAVNNAIRQIPLRGVGLTQGSPDELFPELKRMWNFPTENGIYEYTLPTAILMPYQIYSLDDPVYPGDGAGNDREVYYKDEGSFQTLNKSTTGWPRNFSISGRDLLIHHVPSTDYLTYIRIWGLKSEDDLTSDSSSPLLRRDFDQAVAFHAASVIADLKSQHSEANALLSRCDDQLRKTIAPLGLLLSNQGICINVVGAPI